MSFQNLTPELQNIILVNHNYMTKWFMFILIILISCYYVFIVWPSHKQTIYITQAILRLFFYGLSIVYLTASPVMVLLMTPEYSFLDWYLLPLKIYGIFTSILGILLFIDILRLGLFYLLGRAGLDLGNENISEMIRNIENNRHFMKWKKNGGFKNVRR